MIDTLKKTLKYMLLIIIGAVLLLVITGILFVKFSPEFGGTASQTDIQRYESSGHFTDNKFHNDQPTPMDMSLSDIAGLLKDMVTGVPHRRPEVDLPVEKIDSLGLVAAPEHSRLIWFGHSAFLLQMDGKNILIDPMFGQVPAPHPLLGGSRYYKELPIEIEKLPVIDLMIISHDHYDHLDYGSIQKLKDKTKAFYVPLGVGAHFIAWGVPEEMVHEMNWWDETQVDGIKLAFTPAQHFSGRGPTNRWSTLWGSWVIQGKTENIYFSGDSGYSTHFKEIGEKYGPFNFAMIECGQYNEKWSEIHMMPEESAQAAVDLNTKLMMPIHWGAFSLALHSWTDPVERVTKKAIELNMPFITPQIGEPIIIGNNLPDVHNDWWKNVKNQEKYEAENRNNN